MKELGVLLLAPLPRLDRMLVHHRAVCRRYPFMRLSSASLRGGGGGVPRADVGEYGDFMGTLQQISALVVGEMWGLLLN